MRFIYLKFIFIYFNQFKNKIHFSKIEINENYLPKVNKEYRIL